MLDIASSHLAVRLLVSSMNMSKAYILSRLYTAIRTTRVTSEKYRTFKHRHHTGYKASLPPRKQVADPLDKGW